MRKAFLFVAMLGLGACSGMALRSGRPSEPIPGPMTGRIPGTIDTEGETGPMNNTLPSSSGRQTLCRSTPYPRGWVAVDYVEGTDRKSTRLNSSHLVISYAVFCLK